MFKLESYLTPWLLGYLDKYVKLKPEDFQLSLWGGDAVFNKLDLRLNVIESLTNIPITFKSGVIHELRIHIPWTRITSEPVVVTINTLEFVAKLKDLDNSSSTSNIKTPSQMSPESSFVNANTQTPETIQSQSQLPTGYIQNIISKILFNICIIVNNVIVKFVEDDMVLSFNMKSAECFSVNHLWEKTFVDVNTQNIHLRKILQLNDVTICLDKLDNKKNSNTKISFYQDPLIYRCSIQSRLDFKYSNLNNSFDQQLKLMKLSFYCRKFDVSITDQQLPMVIRLVELILAIVDGTLKLPETDSENITFSFNENILRGSQLVQEIKTNLQTNQEEEESQEQGWMSWAWSYVPSVSNLIPTEPQTAQTQISSLNNSNNQIQMIIGCYFDEFNLSFKLTSNQINQQQQQFSQFIRCHTKGIALEVNKKEHFTHILFGISHINLKSMGECCCKLCPKPSSSEIVFLTAGSDYIEDKIFHYLSGSLFDIVDDTVVNTDMERNVSGEEDKNEKSRDKFGNFDENYGLKRFGAIFMDYLDSATNLNTNKSDNAEIEASEMDINLELNPNQPDIFSLNFIFYGIQVNVSANLIHRLVKIYDCSLAHTYTEPYASLTSAKSSTSLTELVLIDDLSSKTNTEKLARKFEKYIPTLNYTFTFKEPVIKFHPYSHFLIASIASQNSNYDCYLSLNAKYIYFNIIRPLDEKALFDVVSKLPNPSKKLIYDSYVHNQVTADSLKLNLSIIDSRTNQIHESTIIEPCYIEFHFSNVIMSPEMWNKQYFPLKEFVLELPILKINLQKQFLFILNDYLDNYVFPLLNESMIMQIKHPFINKSQMKKAKLRQMIFKRLLEDYLHQSTKYFNKSEILRICINDLKAKHSFTKIMQIIQLNCNMCNVYLYNNDQTDDFIPLIETSNKSTGKNSNIKDFLVLRAQLPLEIDSENSYIPDPLFVYLNLNEINIQLRDELLNWLNYKPTTKGDDELLNLLVLELFDDVNEPDLKENVNLLNKLKLNSQKQKFYVQKIDQKSIETASTSSIHIRKQKMLKVRLDESTSSVLSTSSHKPTIIDTFYDLLKTLHIQISIKPISISLNNSKESKKQILLNLPQIDSKSSGTKCDLEEELINNKLIQLPCTYLRACEKTSNKLPWLVEFKSLQCILVDSSDKKTFLLSPIDLNTFFTVKPKYHQYDNLLSSLSITLNLDISKKIDLNLEKCDLNLLVNWFSKINESLLNFEFRIDYKQLESINMFDRNQVNRNQVGSEWDENKSYSTISILKEYDLSSFDEQDDLEEFYQEEEHCSLSTGELSSSSSSVTNLKLKQKRMNLLSPVVHLIEREKNQDQVKINLSVNFFILNLNLNLIDQNNSVKFSLNRFLSESDINNVYQKYSVKIKKFEIRNEPFKDLDSLIFSTENKEENFLEITFTNALISNLNKKLNESFKKKSKKLKSNLKNISSAQKWINEVNLVIRNFDFYFSLKRLNLILEFYFNLTKLILFKQNLEKNNSKRAYLIPIIQASQMPLLNIELKKIRFILPKEDNTNSLILQFMSLTLSSQVENPLIRNFIQNTTSLNIYNKAKSNGLLYRPGFIFEDRQYHAEIKSICLINNTKAILDNFDLKLALALPILLGKRLINGYAVELSVPTSNLAFNFTDLDLNLIFELINENKFNFEQELNTKQSKLLLDDLELVPLDILLTCEKTTISFSKNQNLLFYIQLIQPHLCFLMHEKMQKFEISIFDILVKRGVISVLETKPGEANPKTGILSGVFSFKISNFANLFCFDSKTKNKIEETSENLICVCNKCLRCYEIKNTYQISNSSQLSTQIFIERPLKLKVNLAIYQDILEFMQSLKFMQKNTQDMDNSRDEMVQETLMQILFDLNIQMLTSQILIVFEAPSPSLVNLNASLSSLSLSFNRIAKDNSQNENILLRLFLSNSNKQDSSKINSINHFSLKLNDFNVNLNSKLNEYVHFMGPLSIKCNFDYDLTENEINSFVDLGSFSLSFNRFLFESFMQFKHVLDELTPKKNKFSIESKKIESDNLQLSSNDFIIYEDDLRNGSLKYKIIDDSYFKKSQTDSCLSSIEYLLSHSLLPSSNEIICIDDLSDSSISQSHEMTSSVCWRYSKKRSLTSLKILPLPLVGNTISIESDQKSNLKCYLEYFNECTKCFVVLKEFYIQEGVYTIVLDNIIQNLNYKQLVYSKIWRIRLSKEAKRFIFASSLLASTRIDSIELLQSNKKALNSNIEFCVSNLEFKLNTLKSDLALINLSEFCAKATFNSDLAFVSFSLCAQIGVDFCEYKFLTWRSLVDSFEFRINSLVNLKSNLTNLQIDTNTINLTASQSALIALKQLENELNSKQNLPHYYLIFNDTNLDLNVKQFDTEETCLVESGNFIPYIWRTHKKAQLLQLFLPKYKLTSKAFQINQNSLEEISLQLGEHRLDFLISIETKCQEKSSFKKRNIFGSFKKFIFIQTKFLVCNYLDFSIDSIGIFYQTNGRQFELQENKVEKLSRSKTSFELILSNKNDLEINSIEINKQKISLNLDQLKSGYLWHEKNLNLKFWLNFYEQDLGDKKKSTQFGIVFTPLFLFCSYLPYDLKIHIESKDYLIKSNAVSFYTKNEKLDVKFEHFLNEPKENEEYFRFLEQVDQKNWFQNQVSILAEGNFNISTCDSFENKSLIYVDMFKYYTIKSEIKFEQFDLNILRNESKQVKSAILKEKTESNLIANNFLIEKVNCWNFSKTIRVNIKPECLLVNKSNYNLKLHERILDKEVVYEVDSQGGKVCLSDLGLSTKKFKLSISLDEYELTRGEHVDLVKNTVEYESDWIEIKDEPVSPFYRERFSSKMNCLYLNKCWIDLKLYAINSKKSRLNVVYLVICSEDKNCLNRNLNEIEYNTENLSNEDISRLYESTYRLLTIQPKFLIKNKTNLDLKFKIFNDFTSLNSSLMHKYVQTEEFDLKSKGSIQTGSILDRGNFYIDENRIELSEYEKERERLNDLFYLSLNDDGLSQSKPLILTCKEKAIKQISSSGQVDENMLLSRQCFCVYDKKDSNTKAFILAQKLLVTKNGQLMLILKEDLNSLVNLYNSLEFDILVWPRLSTNFIFENYVRNTNLISERFISKKEKQNDLDLFFKSSLVYMHLIPANSWFKFNYDFIGTNHFPIDNLNEQIFFMFALANKKDLNRLSKFSMLDQKPFDLSPNLCKIYENKVEISFESNKDLKLYYLSGSDNQNTNRYITNEIKTFENDQSIMLTNNSTLNLNLNIERLTLALNDDHLSEIYQTEILRLTIDQLNFAIEQTVQKMTLNTTCSHLQLDNQMFDLNESILDSELSSTSQKYDFPVILLPREVKKQNKKSQNYKSLDFIYETNSIQNDQEKFLDIRIVLVDLNSNPTLTDLDLCIKPFDLYLEDYLIYNLIKIALEFLEFASLNEQTDLNNLEMSVYSNDEADLEILIKPALKIKKFQISRVDALVSLQTSIKLYLATYKMPILFEEFKLNGLPLAILSSPQLVKLFTTHYLTSLLFRAGWLLGSLDLIGSPTAFIQQVSNGVFDFLQMPYRGLRSQGPTGLLQGFSNGSLSLIRNLSAGTITSLTSFASFVSRNMDILSFDPHHLARQEHFRHQTSESFGSGLLQVSSSFIVSIMGAIGGLAEQPIQSVHNSDSLIKGVSKGLIGLITKPVGAVAELVNQTGQGLLRITGVNRIPLGELRLQRKALNKQFSRFSISSTKCLWKLLNTMTNKIYINAMIEAVHTGSEVTKAKKGLNLTACYLVLSDEILYILDKNEDMLLRAFYISQIDLNTIKNNEETVLCVTLNSQKLELFINEYQKMYQDTMDRLVDYVLQTNKSNEEEIENIKPLMCEYYQYSKILVNNLLNRNISLPCMCGNLIKTISLVEKRLKGPSTSAISDSSGHAREKSISEVFFTGENSQIQKHTRQASSSEIPKIHKISSGQLSMPQSPLLPVVSKETESSQQKKFYYYVDPRLSANFINIFNSLKRKNSNKGFQF